MTINKPRRHIYNQAGTSSYLTDENLADIAHEMRTANLIAYSQRYAKQLPKDLDAEIHNAIAERLEVPATLTLDQLGYSTITRTGSKDCDQ